MNKSVVIVGASGHGKVVADIVLKNKDNIVGFLDDNTELEESFAGFPVLGTTDQYQKYSDACFVIAIGNAAVREKLVNELKNVSWYTAIHPTAVISELDANIGEGTVIMANAVVNAGARISMKAGARSAEVILKLLSGEKVDYSDVIDDGAVYSRFDQSIRITQDNICQQVKGVVFDLDDTLYSEKQYIKSGYKAVASILGSELYAEKLWKYFEQGLPAIDMLLNELDCIEKKEECLNIYREHIPEISLYEGVSDLISELLHRNIKVGVITDGRVSGQKKKIQALGLEKLVNDIIITDELGGIQFRKPCDIAFRIMQHRWKIPFEQMIYVGDNVEKDFQAPKQLGMRSIFFKNKDGLYQGEDIDDIQMIDRILKLNF